MVELVPAPRVSKEKFPEPLVNTSPPTIEDFSKQNESQCVEVTTTKMEITTPNQKGQTTSTKMKMIHQ